MKSSFKWIGGVLLSVPLLLAAAAYPSPVFQAVFTSAIDGVVYVAPYNAVLNPNGVKTDCSVDTAATINADIAAALLVSSSVEVKLPPGCLGVTTPITIGGRSGGVNQVVHISGAGREVTTLRAIAPVTSVYWKDGNYNQYGGIDNLTLDGANQATNVFWHQYGSDYQYHDLLIENAAAGGVALRHGTDSTGGLESFYAHIEVKGINPTVYTSTADLPAYAIKLNMTDGHMEDILAWNGSSAIFYESSSSAGNRFVNVHAFGYGSAGGLTAWEPQYCYAINGLGSHYTNWGCDGASVAAVDLGATAFQNTVIAGNAGWAGGSGSVGSANAVRLEGAGTLAGAGSNYVAGNTFQQVSQSQAVYIDPNVSAYNIVKDNTGATGGVGNLQGDNIVFNGAGFASVKLGNGYVASFAAPASASNYISINSSTSTNPVQVAAATTQGGSPAVGLNLTTLNGGTVQANGAIIATANQLPLSAISGTLGGSALTAGQCSTNATTVTGATTSMVPSISPVTYPGDGFVWSAYVSASNTVTSRICAISAGTPTASAYRIRVIQ